MQAMDRRWIILLCLFLGRTALGVQFQSLVSVGEQVAEELSLTYAELGTLIAPWVIWLMAIPAGQLIVRMPMAAAISRPANQSATILVK